MGCILGLRVSPTHRRKGVGLKLITSIEEWMLRNGADYAFLATEKNNNASKNLFTNKCNYVNLTSLTIFLHPTTFPTNHISNKDIKIDKINIDQAISLYTRIFKTKDLYPLDMDVILKEKLSLGTWVSYYKNEGFKLNNEDITTNSSWIIFSLWNTCEANDNKVHDKTKLFQPLRFLHATLNHAKDKICPCLRMLGNESLMCESLGFLFLYGLHGEGENLGGLMESIWSFTSKLGEKLKDCRLVITELGFGDPLVNHVPQMESMSCIDDMWYTKRLARDSDDDVDDELVQQQVMKRQLGNVFVDPRDF
ncbi:probable N-acetyltransferase HLS1 [Trifolium pratense]|nr:probable N-acetyltransferase HLS1 [Trifolium pratense]